MMEGAYFIGRFELLNWLNDLLQLDYSKVEQCGSGAAYCQIMDAIMPGRVPLQKVNFEAASEYEYTKNYKVLQMCFERQGIDKKIDVQALMKCKYQDNLEFLQWIKRYFDLHASSDEYDAVSRRQSCKAAKAANRRNVRPTAPRLSTAKPKRVTTAAPAVRAGAGAGAAPARRTVGGAGAPAAPGGGVRRAPTAAAAAGAAATTTTTNAAQRQVAKLTREMREMQQTIDELEKERDIYYAKLRAVEILCQDMEAEHPDAIKPILERLYADEDEENVAAIAAAAMTSTDSDEDIVVNM